jgi:hypothetical protein
MGHQSHAMFSTTRTFCLLVRLNRHRDGYVPRSKLGYQMRRGPHMRRPEDDVPADSESGRVRVLGRLCCLVRVFTPPAAEVAHLQEYT